MNARGLVLYLIASPLLLAGGCPPHPASNKCGAARSIDGYWLVAELTAEDTLGRAPLVEYWLLRAVSGTGDVVRFEFADACDPSLVLALGELSAEGELSVLDDAGGFVRTFARFVDDHRLEGIDWKNGQRLVARRIEKPDCTEFPDSDGVGVHRQPLFFVREADTDLVALGESAAKTGTQQDSGPNGLAHLNAVHHHGLPFGDDYDRANGEAAEHCQDASGNPIPCPDDPNAGSGGVVECSVQNWSESRQKSLSDVVALSDQNHIYPGALLQGGTFAAGSFSPITIPRAGGTLTLSGLVLAGAHYTTSVEEVSLAKVTDAVADLLQNNEILGTRADASVVTSQVYSAEHFNLTFGVDIAASGLPASISGELNVDTTSTDNLVVLQFTQVYYTMSFEPPQYAWSVFRDGKDFDDPQDQIGEGNPPLYVDNVKYGRQIFLFFRSSYGAQQVEAALKGAANAEGADVKVSGHLTYKDIMSKTRVTYVVRGGDAGLALEPIKNAKPEELYQAILDLIANKAAANFSVSNPGIPVSYTLRYLIDNGVAATSYAITYDKCDCRTYPPTDYHYRLRISHPSQSAWVYLDDTKTLIAGPYRSGTGVVDIDLNDFLSDTGDHTLIIQLYARCLWESAAATFDLYVDGSHRWRDSVSKSAFYTCQAHNIFTGTVGTLFPNEVYEARIRISRRTGKATLLGLSK